MSIQPTTHWHGQTLAVGPVGPCCTATECDFPDCGKAPVPGLLMCRNHDRVRVSGSYVNDRHKDGGHG